MTTLTQITLSSQSMVADFETITCYLCNESSATDSDRCQHCFAPLAISKQIKGRKNRPAMLAVLGSSGAGKTVYLGMLMDMLSRQEKGIHILARGGFSINLQQETVSALARCQFPSQTPQEAEHWHWVHGQVQLAGGRRPREVLFADPAGEAIVDELEHPDTYPAIRTILDNSEGVLVLIDTLDLESGSREQEYFPMKVLSYLAELNGKSRHGWPNRPLGIVFTKSDQCDACSDDPAEYARKRVTAVWQQCQHRFQRHQFFACGMAGAFRRQVDRKGNVTQAPLRIEPRGVVEPFEWLVKNLR